jgi:hypothetical protein
MIERGSVMKPLEVEGARGLIKALRGFTTDFAAETQAELGKAMAPVARRARGYIPSHINLSGWMEGNQKGKWQYRAWDRNEAIAGIGYNTQPSRPNRNGFTTLARIVNASAAGAIYETAGRKNPEGRKVSSQVTVKKSYYSYEYTRKGTNKESGSNNPWAGAQFIDALNEQGLIVDANTRTGAGRRGRKKKGRAIFRAWKEDGGKTVAAVEKAIENSRDKFYMKARKG